MCVCVCVCVCVSPAGEVHEAGAGRGGASVGLHRQTGHQHVWEVSGRQHRGVGGGVLSALLGSYQHPGPLCGESLRSVSVRN